MSPKRRLLLTLAIAVSLGCLLTYAWKRQEHAEELFVLNLSSDLKLVAQQERGPESAHLLTGHTNYYRLLLKVDKALAYRRGWMNNASGKWTFHGPQSGVLVWIEKVLGADFHIPQSQILVLLRDGRALPEKGRERNPDILEPAWSTLDIRTVRAEPGPETPLFTNGVPGWSIVQVP